MIPFNWVCYVFFLTEPFYWKTKFDVAPKCFTDVVDLIARLSQDLGYTWFSEGSQTEWSILLSCLDGVKVYYQSTIDLSSLNLLFKVVLYLACFCLPLRFLSLFCFVFDNSWQVIDVIKNKRGPKIEPWWTPQVMGEHDECVPDKSTYCVLSERYDLNHKMNIIVYARSF